jgi:hypothetical protein
MTYEYNSRVIKQEIFRPVGLITIVQPWFLYPQFFFGMQREAK